jgi:CheY-like chemotaxis protein
MARVLVVEDEETLGWTLRDVLEGEGHEADVAINGLDAVERVERHTPDVLVLDMMLPILDGFGVLERVRKSREAGMKVVVISSMAPKELAKLSVDAVLAKPFSLDALLDALDNTAGR